MIASLITPDVKIKVSSTLDRSVGKNHLVDGSPETCWTSQEGLPQYVQLRFPTKVTPKRISLTFQGGFVGTKCTINGLNHLEQPPSWEKLASIYPQDINREQVFELDFQRPEYDGTEALQIVFEQSSDFFGRITVYDLKLEGIVQS